MLNKFRYLNLVIALALMLVVAVFVPRVSADCSAPQTPQEQIQCGACNASGTDQTACSQAPGTAANNLNSTLKNVINIASLIGGVLAVIMLIVGGIRYATSSGNEQAVTGAKRTIIYALTGLVIVAVAQVVVHFVLHNVTTAVK